MGILTALAWLVPHETAAISAQVLCTPYNHAACHFMQSHIRKVYTCLAVTCHLHFWQNGRDLLRATAVTWGWNGYRNKSQHRKSTLKKKILTPLQQGFEPATFQSRVRRSNRYMLHQHAGVLCCRCFMLHQSAFYAACRCFMPHQSADVLCSGCCMTHQSAGVLWGVV